MLADYPILVYLLGLSMGLLIGVSFLDMMYNNHGLNLMKCSKCGHREIAELSILKGGRSGWMRRNGWSSPQFSGPTCKECTDRTKRKVA